VSSFAFFGVALSAAMRAQRLGAKVAAETIVGKRGVVVTPIDPVGTVQVHSELWTAVADESIGAGEEVEVVALEGLRARVTRVSSTQHGRE
jgi:membrane-bound serine protease (ClpP class)